MVGVFIMLCFYACVSGAKDGIIYGKQGADSFDFNEHVFFVLERCFVGLIAILGLYFGVKNVLDIVATILSFLFCFPFLHNGCYYVTRSYIDIDYYHWYSDSKTSSAKFNFSFLLRTLLFFIGVIVFACYLLFC